MSTLTICTDAQKRALADAVSFSQESLSDHLLDLCNSVATVEMQAMDVTLREITDVRKRLAFTKAFSQALAGVPVGMSVYLESLETEVIREGLEALLEFGDDGYDPIDEVLSTANVQRLILLCQTEWGSLDTVKFAAELRQAMRETGDLTRAINELLDALK